MLALAFGASVVIPAAAQAQTCLGFPSFDNGSIRLSAGASFAKDVTGYVAGLAAGAHQGAFFGGGYARVEDKEYSASSNQAYIDAGLQFPLGRLQLCPVLGAVFSSGPNAINSPDEKNTAMFGAAGLAVGLSLGSGPLAVVPNVSVKWEYAQYKATYDDAAANLKETEQSGVVDAGLGIVLWRRLSVQPTLQIPFSSANTDPVYGVLVAFSLGHMR
jgi:hypothetical protein